MASGDVLAFLQSDWVVLWAATLHNSMYGNVPGLFSPYKIGLDAPGYSFDCLAQHTIIVPISFSSSRDLGPGISVTITGFVKGPSTPPRVSVWEATGDSHHIPPSCVHAESTADVQ